MKILFSGQILDKYINVKFHYNPSSGKCSMRTDVRTDAFRNFANAPKNRLSSTSLWVVLFLVLSRFLRSVEVKVVMTLNKVTIAYCKLLLILLCLPILLNFYS